MEIPDVGRILFGLKPAASAQTRAAQRSPPGNGFQLVPAHRGAVSQPPVHVRLGILTQATPRARRGVHLTENARKPRPGGSGCARGRSQL